MKNLILLLFSTVAALSASAQQTQVADTSRSKEDMGQTAYGLPVHKSYVPEDAVDRAKKKYGRALYSIEKTTAANCQNSYLVGLIRNGRLTVEWMCDDPKVALFGNTSGSTDLARKN